MSVHAIGRAFVTFSIRAVTGLHIGGRGGGLEIGGMDNPVIRDPLTNQPFIPGSSLKGKMRSLSEKQHALPSNWRIGDSKIHVCEKPSDYATCLVCRVFGTPGEKAFSTPTRLLVRDVQLTEESASKLDSLSLDRPYTEVKTEVAIDRVTSAAHPRPLERVPAGAVFGPGEMVYTVYTSDDGSCNPHQDVDLLGVVFEAMQLLEHDYLGGSGSRGSGKVAFEKIQITVRSSDNYFATEPQSVGSFPKLTELIAEGEQVLDCVREKLNLRETGSAGGHS